jgi:hypothetical protein
MYNNEQYVINIYLSYFLPPYQIQTPAMIITKPQHSKDKKHEVYMEFELSHYDLNKEFS